MPDKRKPRRKPLSYLDAQDKVINLRAIYQTQAFGSADRTGTIARQQHRDLDEVATPEPNEELEDSELSDFERQAAIARERTRREGRA